MTSDLSALGLRAKEGSFVLAHASSAQKNEALSLGALAIEERAEELLGANALDLERASSAQANATVIDRLSLTPRRIAAMAEGLRQVEKLADPIGSIVEGYVRPNGLRVRRVRVPFGVVGIVYENRPNVTADAVALCLKSGNAAFLRGSAGAIESNRAITAVLRDAIDKAGLPADAVVLVEDTAHETVEEFVRLRGIVDLIVPRGGPALIGMVIERATVPYVIDGDGNCHVYVDAQADLDMAHAIVLNAKMQRPSVCNAMETLLVHQDVAQQFLSRLCPALDGVELVGDARTKAVLPEIGDATEEDYATEFLALKMSIAVVDDLSGALADIKRYSTGHSEAIITNDRGAATRFTQEVDAAAVLVNASTRFVDGFELGLGAEIGISTQKLHARGPMGLEALTSVKYVIEGDGQIRT